MYMSPSPVLSRPLTNYMSCQIVAWPEDRICDRSWLLDKVADATGVIVLLTDKVGLVLISLLR